jgi:hypothetical protein
MAKKYRSVVEENLAWSKDSDARLARSGEGAVRALRDASAAIKSNGWAKKSARTGRYVTRRASR